VGAAGKPKEELELFELARREGKAAPETFRVPSIGQNERKRFQVRHTRAQELDNSFAILLVAGDADGLQIQGTNVLELVYSGSAAQES
jgi:hypothetical protein